MNCVTLWIAVASIVVLVGPADGQSSSTPANEADLSVEYVCSILGGHRVEDLGLRELHQAGRRAFRAYEIILADPKSKPEVVFGVLEMLASSTLDRCGFLPSARQRMTDPDPRVRYCAAKLVGHIGTAQDTPALAAFLCADHRATIHVAAWGLANIGGEHDIIALDIWLLGGRHRDDPKLREFVTKCRDELKARLEKAKKVPR